MGMIRPKLVAHADWSSNPAKRWMAVARLDSKARYCVAEPEIVLDSGMLRSQLKERSGGGSVLLGFDFPIGLPSAYCQIAQIGSFMEVLPAFGKNCWAYFYEVARNYSQISVHQPFYPFAPGGKLQQHLLNGLHIKGGMKNLLRDCERPTNARAAASPLFWTLGAKQVGRAAIAGWRDVLAPAFENRGPQVKIWPFAGDLSTLLESSEMVIVETYPAEACVQIGLGAPGKSWSKRKQDHRRAFSPILQKWARDHDIELGVSLIVLLNKGFESSPFGEDKFDAVAGLVAMLGIITDNDSYDAPPDIRVRIVEGWIFGLPPVPLSKT